MASKQDHSPLQRGRQFTGIVLLAVYLTLLIFVQGCPDPRRHVLFLQEGRFNKKYEVRDSESDVELHAYGRIYMGGMFNRSDNLLLDLFLMLEYDKDDCVMELSPDAMRVFVDTTELQGESTLNELDTQGKHVSYRVDLVYRYDGDISELLSTRYRGDTAVAFAVVIGGAITCSGTSVFGDTIHCFARY